MDAARSVLRHLASTPEELVPARHAQDADALSSQLQGPFLRDRFEDTDALGRPLLLCSWAQFHPILQYIQGQPLDLPHSKQQLRDLQKLAQRWELSGLDHIVRQRLRQQQGGEPA